MDMFRVWALFAVALCGSVGWGAPPLHAPGHATSLLFLLGGSSAMPLSRLRPLSAAFNEELDLDWQTNHEYFVALGDEVVPIQLFDGEELSVGSSGEILGIQSKTPSFDMIDILAAAAEDVDVSVAPEPGVDFHPALIQAPTAESRAEAVRNVAQQLGVTVEDLIVTTPPDGMCLYHAIHAFTMGPAWSIGRGQEGFQSDLLREALEGGYAIYLRDRLAKLMRDRGLASAAEDLYQGSANYFPGSRELPYLAEIVGATIVEHSLEHPEQPPIAHGDGVNRMHLGFTVTELGAPHFVLLNSDSNTIDLSSDVAVPLAGTGLETPRMCCSCGQPMAKSARLDICQNCRPSDSGACGSASGQLQAGAGGIEGLPSAAEAPEVSSAADSFPADDALLDDVLAQLESMPPPALLKDIADSDALLISVFPEKAAGNGGGKQPFRSFLNRGVRLQEKSRARGAATGKRQVEMPASMKKPAARGPASEEGKGFKFDAGGRRLSVDASGTWQRLGASRFIPEEFTDKRYWHKHPEMHDIWRAMFPRASSGDGAESESNIAAMEEADDEEHIEIEVNEDSDENICSDGAMPADEEEGGGRSGNWRGGGKTRRLPVGEAGEEDEKAEDNKDTHPDAQIDAQLIPHLDEQDDDLIPPDLLEMVRQIRERLRLRRQLRPYAELVPYGGVGCQKRTRNPHIGRAGLKRRVVCAETMYTMPAKTLALICEGAGIVHKRPKCATCEEELQDTDLRIRATLGHKTFTGPGGHEFHHKREQASCCICWLPLLVKCFSRSMGCDLNSKSPDYHSVAILSNRTPLDCNLSQQNTIRWPFESVRIP
jgi:hypothetical protein